MADADWQGAAGGMRAAEHDMAANAYMGAQADLMRQKADAQRKFAGMAAGQPQMGGAQGGNPLWGVARMALDAGLPDAYKYANTASLIDSRTVASETQRLRQVEIGVKAQTEILDLKGRLFSAATSDDSWRQAALDFERQTGQRTGIVDQQGNLIQPFSPEAKGRLIAQSMSAKDRLLLDWRNRALTSANQERESRQRSRDFWQNMENQREREEAKQRGRTAAHGDSALFPSNAQITIGSDFIAEKFGVDSKEPWARVMGRELIDKAKRMRTLNPGLSASDAIQQAFVQLDKSGTFSSHRLVDKNTDLNRPLPLPEVNKIDELKVGQVYTDGRTLRKWTGKGWATPTMPITQGGNGEFPISDADARRALNTAPDDNEEDGSTDGDDDDDEED